MSLAYAARRGEWVARPGLGVYVHIPFCKHRCHYCDFNTYEGQDHLHASYVDALAQDIERTAPTQELPPASSVFFGGGTPTLLAPDALGRILQAVRNRVGITDDAEVSVEANPETVDESTFSALIEAGFNRVSVGVQSVSAHVLEGLGRTHSSDEAIAALTAARRAGVTDLNADLIYGSPWENDDDWRASLDAVAAIAPDHISCYALTVEEATPLATLVRTGRVRDVDPDVQADRHAQACEVLSSAGYARYEISNWAQPDHASRHNVMYWSAGNYLGFGAGAHGHLDGRRYWNIRLPRNFVERVQRGDSVEAGFEVLTPDVRAGEALMLGLRLESGVDLVSFADRFGRSCLDTRARVIDALVASELLEVAGGWLRLTNSSTLLANEALAQLL